MLSDQTPTSSTVLTGVTGQVRIHVNPVPSLQVQHVWSNFLDGSRDVQPEDDRSLGEMKSIRCFALQHIGSVGHY